VGVKFPNPATALSYILKAVRDMGGYSAMMDSVLNRRTSFYDAAPVEDQAPALAPALDAYWQFVDDLHDTDLRFGEVRGRRTRQKGVDVLLAVDMLVGAVNQVFDVAILISGDADFVPAVNEVRRRGISVVVAGVESSMSKELRAASDRFVPLSGAGSWALTRDPFTPC
jgi:uncharacterized LabA/DUF88 family protein